METPAPTVPPPEGGGTPSTPDPNVVLLLNLFLAGVGYFLIGQKTKGVIAILVAIVAGILTCGWGAAVVGIITAIDGRMQAERLRTTGSARSTT